MLLKIIDREIEKRSLLKHPFYQMWSEGRLNLESLRGYAMEYFSLVKAVPSMVEQLLTQTPDNEDIKNNLDEEREHIIPWVKFAQALGVKKEELERYVPSMKARHSIAKMFKLMEKFDNGLAAMYAYEAQLPKISRSKIDGLTEFYGISDEDGTEYFKIHECVDVRHAAVWRNMLAKISADRHEEVCNSAVSSLIAQNEILDAVNEKYVKAI